MAGMEDELERVLQTPDEVRRSRSDDNVNFSMNFMSALKSMGNGCVVVKYLPDDALSLLHT
jgi:hypothetical protein